MFKIKIFWKSVVNFLSYRAHPNSTFERNAFRDNRVWSQVLTANWMCMDGSGTLQTAVIWKPVLRSEWNCAQIFLKVCTFRICNKKFFYFSTYTLIAFEFSNLFSKIIQFFEYIARDISYCSGCILSSYIIDIFFNDFQFIMKSPVWRNH